MAFKMKGKMAADCGEDYDADEKKSGAKSLRNALATKAFGKKKK